MEPQIIQYLNDQRRCKIDELINHLHKKTGVKQEKIRFRIEKMASQEKLEIIDKTVFSKQKKRLIDNSYDESFENGPIKLGRKGNIITVQSNWQDGEHEEFLTSVKESLPSLKEELEKKLEAIEKVIVDKYDPLDVLASVTSKNLITDPETYSESSFEGKQLYVEIIQNIILKHTIKEYSKADSKSFDQIEKMLQEYFFQLNNYIMFENVTKENFSISEKEVYFRVLISFLLIRGHAYPQHYKEISMGLFSLLEKTLVQKGFTIEDYWSTVDEIQKQIQDKLNELLKMMHEEHSKFRDFVENEQKLGTEPEKILEKYLMDSAPRREEIKSLMEKQLRSSLKSNFRIQVNDRINQKLLDLLSMSFGENKEWTSPLDKSDIAVKPIVKLNDEYYCFLTVHLIRNVIPIIETLLSNEDKLRSNYSDIKGNFFEQKAIEFLNNLLLGKAYRNLKYPRDNEIDGIIIFNDLVFLIEVKGKKRRIIAGANDILALSKEDFEAHINEAFEQTKKTLNYINSANEVHFRDSKGQIVLRLKRNEIKRIYLINVTLEDFSDLVLNLNLIKSWDNALISGDQFPWVVSIYDLLVISDLLNGQNEAFIRYLNQRIEIEKSENLRAMDELDFLGFFLRNGNLTAQENLKSIKSPLIHGFSEDIDRWYSYKRGEVATAEKPVLKNNDSDMKKRSNRK